jgi:PilZ domain
MVQPGRPALKVPVGHGWRKQESRRQERSAPSGRRLLPVSTKVPYPGFGKRTKFSSHPDATPMKRILRRFSALRNSESRIKAIFFAPRQHPRVYLATEVIVEAEDLNFTARSVQLGSNGMSLEQADQLSLAQPVLLSFALPSGSRVKVGAVVRWKNKEQVGVRFDPRNENRQIQEWIERAVVTVAPEGRGERIQE